jgi:hypothetical protein
MMAQSVAPDRRHGLLILVLLILLLSAMHLFSTAGLSLAGSPYKSLEALSLYLKAPAGRLQSEATHGAALLRVEKGKGGTAAENEKAALPPRTVITVQRVSGLSYDEFRRRFLETQTPVVITDFAHSPQWTIEHINQTCGSRRVNLASRGLQLVESLDPPRLRQLNEQLQDRHGVTVEELTRQLRAGMSIAEFVAFLVSRRELSTRALPEPDYQAFADFLYPYNMHDEFLLGLCPELLDDVTMSRYQQPTGGHSRLTCGQSPRLAKHH